MKQSVRPVLAAAVALTLLSSSPFAVSPAHAIADEIILNSSNVQVVHNTPANTDVLNMSLIVTNNGDTAGSCDGGDDDLLETGVFVVVSRLSCATIFSSFPDFLAEVNYIEHDIGFTASYGTSFALNAAGSVSSKIVALPTPAGTCGKWSINLQATGQNLSGITSPPVALFLVDEDSDAGSFLGGACFDVNANIGNGITKPHHGVHSVRH